jgi:hypothetical protein
MKQVKWQWDWGVYAPFCPYCNEPAYEKDHCVFCGKEYKWVKSKVKDTRVEVGEYTVIQLSNNALYMYKGEHCVMHASSAKKMTEDELREMVVLHEKLCEFEKGADNEQEKT